MANHVGALNTELLLRARLEKGWTARDVAARCKELGVRVDYSSYARYERGITRPGPSKFRAVAKALDLEIEDLLASTGDAA
jgi:transcriptional regulator with XRE-family HTH domain